MLITPKADLHPKKGDIQVMGLERYYVLQDSAKSDVEFKEVLLPNGPIKYNNQ